MGKENFNKEEKERGLERIKTSKILKNVSKFVLPKKNKNHSESLSFEIKAKYRSDEICWGSLTNGQPCSAKRKPGT